MRRAIKTLKRVDYVLVDAFYIPYLRGLRHKNQLAIKKGDQCCFSIAAASILAKVHRDQIMVKLSKRHPKYGLQQNKGYGTLFHRQAIVRHGPKRFHRRKFIEKTIEKKGR
jgi:ribonuclease HII